MIDEESEPSLFRDFLNNLSSSPTNSTTSESTTTDDEEQNTNLERKTSISLYNVSSTPQVFKPLKKCRFRTKSHFNIDSDYEYKPKKKKYDHVESKVKQYRNVIREQTEYRRTLRQQQEDEIRKELENNLKALEPYERKKHSLKFLPNVITNEDLKENLSNLSPIVNIAASNENTTVFIEEPIELKEKYNQALNEIEHLQIEITKLKAAKSITPRLSRRKSLQSSMIKTCLFKNSSTAIRQSGQQNYTPSSIFGGDSTCRTIDIEDLMSPTSRPIKEEETNNPFIIKSPCALSPNAESIANSSAPLLYNYERPRMRNSVYKFFNNLIKCPKMGFLHKLKRNNKVAPMPNIVISRSSPREESYEFIHQISFHDDILLDSPKQALILKEMTDCCERSEQLSERINRLKRLVVNNYMNKNNNNNN